MESPGTAILERDDHRRTRSGAAAGPLLIVAVLAMTLFIGLLPFASTLIIHHPDERHYSDGAAIMLETGDWLTPRTGAGEVRVRKPPLTYWIEAAGMAVAGIGPLGARLGNLLLGAAMLPLVYLLARTAGGGRQTALLAAALLAGNLVFILSTLHALPDQALTFGLLVSAIGFTGLLFRPEPAGRYAWLAYGGLAVGVLAKGFLPVAFLIYTVCFALFHGGAGRRRLWQPLPILACLLLSCGWFAYQSLNQPSGMADQLLYDQIVNKLRGIGPGTMLSSLVSGLTGLIAPNALVLLALAYGLRRGARPSLSEIGGAARYFLGWCALIVLIFTFSAYATHRYVLPAVPLVAVLAAAAMQSLAAGPAAALLRAAFKATLVLATLLLVGLLVVSTAILPAWQGLGLIMLALAGAALIWRLVGSPSLPVAAAAMSVLPHGLLFLAFPVFGALFLPDVGKALATALRQAQAGYERTLFVGDEMTAAQTRLHLGTGRGFHQAERLGEVEDFSRFAIVATDKRELADALEATGFARAEVRAGWRDIHGYDFRAGLATWDLAAQREKNAKLGYVLTRP
jgi:4-amino-4-deoxy-L-arabinose transferase-like glycosyltransferase